MDDSVITCDEVIKLNNRKKKQNKNYFNNFY